MNEGLISRPCTKRSCWDCTHCCTEDNTQYCDQTGKIIANEHQINIIPCMAYSKKRPLIAVVDVSFELPF